MVELYVKKIKDDYIDFTLEDVPKLWKQKVIKRLIDLTTSHPTVHRLQLL